MRTVWTTIIEDYASRSALCFQYTFIQVLLPYISSVYVSNLFQAADFTFTCSTGLGIKIMNDAYETYRPCVAEGSNYDFFNIMYHH